MACALQDNEPTVHKSRCYRFGCVATQSDLPFPLAPLSSASQALTSSILCRFPLLLAAVDSSLLRTRFDYHSPSHAKS